MINQLQRHFVITFGTKQGVFTEVVEETLLKRFLRQHSIASGVSGYISRGDLPKLFSHLLVTYITMQSVVTDSVKSLWQNVLNHTSDESEYREGFVFNLSCFMIPIPVADIFAVILFNSANRDRRRDDIFCQVLSQSSSSMGHISWLKESDKAPGIIFPCPVNVSFNSRIGNIFSEHFQNMVLPFSVHHVIRNIRDILPLLQWVKPTCGHEDMQMGVVMSGASGGLENDNISDIEFDAGAGVEDIFETGITCSHEWTEQSWITVKPYSQEFRHGQYDMTISYAGQQPSSDEVGPSVGISLCTGKAKAGFAGKGNASCFSTVAASVLYKAHLFRIAAVQHFLDSFVVIGTIKAWTKLLKRIPMVIANLLECFFINAFHGCSLRTTIVESTEWVEEKS